MSTQKIAELFVLGGFHKIPPLSRGVPKKLISVGDKGADGVKKSEIFADLIYGSPLGPSTLSLRGGKLR